MIGDTRYWIPDGSLSYRKAFKALGFIHNQVSSIQHQEMSIKYPVSRYIFFLTFLLYLRIL